MPIAEPAPGMPNCPDFAALNSKLGTSAILADGHRQVYSAVIGQESLVIGH
jgi:hypothetical protein